MSLYSYSPPEKLDSPVLIASLRGWVDAAGVGSAAAEHLSGHGPVVAEFDGDQLFDYRSSRPVVDFIDGHLRKLEWPELVVQYRRIGGRDLLILRGTEPDLRWRAFSSAVSALAASAGVSEFIAIGSVPAPVPHTIATPLMMTSPDSDLLVDDTRTPEGLLRVPGAALTVLSHRLSSDGIPARGYWAQVPQYVNGPFYQGVIVLLERIADRLGIAIPLDTLPEEALQQREHLDGIVSSRPEIQKVVEKLEEIAEQGDEIPTADEIGSQVEQFLREASDDGGDPFRSEGP
ncbi:MAG TPA: PAC2 family protein [Acidimicrobiia bacterium]|nr:PAC2 family protein [Acidimicrobiia bacterium]